MSQGKAYTTYVEKCAYSGKRLMYGKNYHPYISPTWDMGPTYKQYLYNYIGR